MIKNASGFIGRGERSPGTKPYDHMEDFTTNKSLPPPFKYISITIQHCIVEEWLALLASNYTVIYIVHQCGFYYSINLEFMGRRETTTKYQTHHAIILTELYQMLNKCFI